MNTKKEIIALTGILLLCGCGSKTDSSEHQNSDDYTGPQVSADVRTPQEKEVDMIQSCISAYNNHETDEIEKEMNITLPPLPIEVSSLPEINSLDDLTEIKDDEVNSNTVYVGRSQIDQKYSAVYRIYTAAGNSFWSSGTVEFEADPGQVTVDDPQFADYKSALDQLLNNESSVLQLFYGLGIETSDTPGTDDQYYLVTSGPSSIAEIKQKAEEIFTADYLESTWYPSAFEGKTPMYKEIDGALYAQKSDLSSWPSTSTYNTDYIAAAEADDSIVNIDILSDVMNQIQPELSRIQLVQTADGYRLPSAY